MDLAFIIIQILSALYNNDVTALYILVNSFKNIIDTNREIGVNNPQEQINVIKSYVTSCATTDLHKSILIQSIDSASQYDVVGCLEHTAKNLVAHSETVIEIIKGAELFEVCNGRRGSRRYLKHISDQCSSKNMMLTQAGLTAIEESDLLRTHYFLSVNGYVSNCGLARIMLLTLCCGAL
uniref:p20B n=1 Tax=Grapevine leafroll-associated virus 3 TaxID=55951 RepID=A0A3S9SDQ4_9CLOS|nr:p20B [Grapevine leafroll-associated virus 3]